MTALDEAPEQRWRRTVDRRNRPAKLKVDRLLRDFGYAELDADVGDAIEARLAGVALAVAPSLRDAAAGEVVTIYANDGAAPDEGATAPQPGAAGPVAAEEPAVASDVAQMVSYLKQQVLDARAEAERLRTELDRRIGARMDAERENEAIITEQAAALEAQSRQLAELSAALDSTRQALADTRDEIRRAVGDLQALPEPVPADIEAELLAADDAAAADEDATDDFGMGDEEWADGREEAVAAALVPEPSPDGDPDRVAEEFALPPSAHAAAPEDDRDEPELTVVEPVPEVEPRAARRDAPMLDLDESAPVTDEAPVAEVPDPAFDLDEPALGMKDHATQDPDAAFDLDEPALGADQAPVAERPEPAFDLDEPARGADQAPDGREPVFDLDEPALGADPAPVPAVPEPSLELDEPAMGVREDAPADGARPELDPGVPAAAGEVPAPQAHEFDGEPPPRAAETPASDDIGDWQPEIPLKPPERETLLHAMSDPEEPVTVPPAPPEPSDDLDSPLAPADEWLPADLRSPPDAGAPAPEPLAADAGEPEGELTDFDDFLYDAEELYDPAEPERAAGGDALLESEIEAHWPDEPAPALPPPPPAPPSPFGDELAPEPPTVAERATLGKVLRGRGGRARGRWEGSCSICGREPQVNRRKDLQAAGWDLDDDAAACPQCRGVG